MYHAKEVLTKMSLTDLAKEFKAAKERHESDDQRAKESKEYLDMLAKQIIPERMDDMEITSMNIDGVGRLQKKADIQCNVLAGNRDLLQQWLRENGFADLISETVNPSTLKSWVKDMMKNGEQVPEELINIHMYQVASLVKT